MKFTWGRGGYVGCIGSVVKMHCLKALLGYISQYNVRNIWEFFRSTAFTCSGYACYIGSVVKMYIFYTLIECYECHEIFF